jgi:hypothetical protein
MENQEAVSVVKITLTPRPAARWCAWSIGAFPRRIVTVARRLDALLGALVLAAAGTDPGPDPGRTGTTRRTKGETMIVAVGD